MKKILIALTLLVSSVAYAAPVTTERPTFTGNAVVVEKGDFQVEAGYTNFRLNGVKTETYGEVLTRYGVTPRLEVRVLGNSYQVTKATGSRVSGLQDTGIAVKYAVLSGATTLTRPNLAVEVGTSTPTGNQKFSANSYTPRARVVAGWDLGEKTTLNAGLSISRADAGCDRTNTFTQSAVLGHSVSAKTGVFVEVFNLDGSNVASNSFAQTGVTYRLNGDTQLDARVGKGLNAGKADFFGFGVSRRF